MGNNSVSQRNSNPKHIQRTKVMLYDGSIHEFEPPITAAELMLDNPNQAVVQFRSDIAGKRPIALPADSILDPANLYLMLPMKQGRAAISGDDLRRVIAAASSNLRRPSTSSFLPVFARVCVAATTMTKKRDREREIERERETTIDCGVEEKKRVSLDGLEENSGADVYFLSRQCSVKRGNWKPTLDTIQEKVYDSNANINNKYNDVSIIKPEYYKKVSHWLF